MRYLVTLCITIALFTPLVAFSATIAPLSQSLSVDPGEVVTVEVKFTNDSDNSVTVHPSIVGVTIDEVTGSINYESTTPLLAWVNPLPEQVLSAQVSQILSYTFTIPKSAEPGVYYAALTSAVQAGEGQIGVNVGVGSLLTLYVSGDITESVSVRQLSFEDESIWSNQKTVFLELENEGNIHTEITGKIIARTPSGEFLVESPMKLSMLYGGMRRQENVSFEIPDSYSGQIRISVEGMYGITQKTFGKQLHTWYIAPKYIFLVGAGVILGLLFTLFVLFRKKKVTV